MTDLPTGWKKVRFGDTFKVRYGKAIDKALRKDSARYPVVGSAGIMTYTDEPLTEEPTIVIGRKGNVGSIQIFEEGCYPIDTTYYMQSTNQFNIKFLTLLLTSLELVKLDSSTATPSLRREDLENVSFFVPPLPEQQKIVEILEDHLSRLDAALADVKQARLKAAQFRRSVLNAAFTGKLSGEESRFMAAWKNEKLSSLLAVSIGGIWGEAAGIADIDVSVVRVTELKAHGRIDPSSAVTRSVTLKQLASRELQEGDLLLEKSGGGPNSPVGRVGYFSQGSARTVCSNFMQLMRPDSTKVLPKYLFHFLDGFHSNGGTIPMQTATTNIRNIKTPQYMDIDVPVPSIDEQHKIVELLEDHLSRLEASVAIGDAMEEQSASLRRSLLQAAFTGQLTKEVASV